MKVFYTIMLRMKKLIHKIKRKFKIYKIERKESHFDWKQANKVLTFWFFFFLWYILLMPPMPKNESVAEWMFFQFHGSAADWWVSDEQTHGAADRWWYLFDENSSGSQNNVFSWSSISKTIPTAKVVSVSSESKYAKIITWMITIPNYYVAVETLIFSRDMAVYYLENFLEGDRSKLIVDTNIYKGCISPSWESLVHGDFMLAYQQREDVSTICNVEKRYCNDGMLGGSYTQDSCEEKTAYAYDKIDPISYNSNAPSEYVQPSPPANASAPFDSQGKINWKLDPTTRWEAEPADAIVVNNKWIRQTVTSYKDCRTPRNEKVLNWHFVRAYKERLWYFNRPCEVEIRMCIDGHLKWNFINKACSSTWVSYEMAHGIQ